MFRRTWWKFYEQPLWLEREDGAKIVTTEGVELVASWDLTFKHTNTSDFVVGQVWMRRGAHAFLLDQVRARMDFVETCDAIRRLSAKWPQATMKLVEDKANGPAVIAALQHTVPGIVPEEPHGSKESRAHAVAPLVEAGNVWLPSPEMAPWVDVVIDECAGFPTASHDDIVDSMTQALNRLFLQPFANGDLWQPEEYDVIDLRGYYSSPV